MRKFLKIYFKINIFVSLLLMMYSCFAFIASAFNIAFMTHYTNIIQSVFTFGLSSFINGNLYIVIVSLFCFFINQYFYNIYRTLYNFDKFREITGIGVVPMFGILQLVGNTVILGVLSIVPFVLGIIATILLHKFQKDNRSRLIAESTHTHIFDDPAMQEKSLKIGQLRILKSEGKISEEEFMFHLNNILEDKE